jgi:hypothetical protein
MTKLESCQHRSDEQMHYGPPCCTSKNLGYYCTLRSIHGVTDPICDACAFYLKRPENTNTNNNTDGSET